MSCDDNEVGAITALVLVALGHGGGVEVILGQSYVSVYVIKEDRTFMYTIEEYLHYNI